jgi:hypothetical protein
LRQAGFSSEELRAPRDRELSAKASGTLLRFAAANQQLWLAEQLTQYGDELRHQERPAPEKLAGIRRQVRQGTSSMRYVYLPLVPAPAGGKLRQRPVPIAADLKAAGWPGISGREGGVFSTQTTRRSTNDRIRH